MSEYKKKFRIGLFFSAGIILIIGMLAFALQFKVGDKLDHYTINFLDISIHGLEVGSPVKYHGVLIGRVREININPKDINSIRVKISIKKGIPLKLDCKVELKLAGISGMKFVDISGGTFDQADYKEGSIIQGSGNVFDTLTGKVEVVTIKAEALVNQLLKIVQKVNMNKLDLLLDNINKLSIDTNLLVNDFKTELPKLLKKSNKILHKAEYKIDSTVQNIDELTLNLNKNLNEANIKNLSENTNQLLIEHKKLTQQVQKDLKISKIPQTVKRFRKTLRTAETILKHMDVTVLQGREDVVKSLRSLKDGLENFEEFTRIIKENPYLIFNRQVKSEVEIGGK